MAPAYKFTYFDIKALAEVTRLLFSYGGIEFEDNRIQRENWPALKPSMPFGQMPILEHNGKVVNQSIAIARYVAKQVKLVGNNDWEDLEIDSIVDTINDFRMKIGAYHYQSDEKIKQALKEPLFKETIPYYLNKFEAIAKENNGHFALGRLTWADMFWLGLIDYMNFMAGTDLIANYPNLRAVVDNASANPNVKAWLEKRPKTDA
ncbi:glutathione S-transferase isoform X2 [Aethina tumida]|nr:glutathione S-transferase isoform X2 [Aethina tumida]XP_019879005.1 glutathione S-transferase isoform X2 [Aethina tumida]